MSEPMSGERLAQFRRWTGGPDGQYKFNASSVKPLVDEILRLRAENERLEQERDGCENAALEAGERE